MDAHTVEKYKDWTIEIHNDTDPMNPRTDFDNLGTMCCWHRRMNLGDNPEKVERFSPIEWMIHELLYNYESKIPYPKDSYCEDWLMEDDARVIEYFNKFHIVLPINAYEHGGITISSGGFSDIFDSGQLGFVYVSHEDIKKEYNVKRLTKSVLERAEKTLRGEVETYDDYLTGNVYGYIIEDENDEQLDSCWGFLGDYKYCLEEAQSAADWHAEQKEKELKLYDERMVG